MTPFGSVVEVLRSARMVGWRLLGLEQEARSNLWSDRDLTDLTLMLNPRDFKVIEAYSATSQVHLYLYICSGPTNKQVYVVI